jgi:hypothetical protein
MVIVVQVKYMSCCTCGLVLKSTLQLYSGLCSKKATAIKARNFLKCTNSGAYSILLYAIVLYATHLDILHSGNKAKNNNDVLDPLHYT